MSPIEKVHHHQHHSYFTNFFAFYWFFNVVTQLFTTDFILENFTKHPSKYYAGDLIHNVLGILGATNIILFSLVNSYQHLNAKNSITTGFGFALGGLLSLISVYHNRENSHVMAFGSAFLIFSCGIHYIYEGKKNTKNGAPVNKTDSHKKSPFFDYLLFASFAALGVYTFFFGGKLLSFVFQTKVSSHSLAVLDQVSVDFFIIAFSVFNFRHMNGKSKRNAGLGFLASGAVIGYLIFIRDKSHFNQQNLNVVAAFPFVLALIGLIFVAGSSSSENVKKHD